MRCAVRQTDVAPETREIFDSEQPPMRFADILETLGRAPVVDREPEVEDRGHFSTRSYANARTRRASAITSSTCRVATSTNRCRSS